MLVAGSCIHLLDYLFMQYAVGIARVMIYTFWSLSQQWQWQSHQKFSAKRMHYIHIQKIVHLTEGLSLWVCVSIRFVLISGLWDSGCWASCEHFRSVPKSFCHWFWFVIRARQEVIWFVFSSSVLLFGSQAWNCSPNSLCWLIPWHLALASNFAAAFIVFILLSEIIGDNFALYYGHQLKLFLPQFRTYVKMQHGTF